MSALSSLCASTKSLMSVSPPGTVEATKGSTSSTSTKRQQTIGLLLLNFFLPSTLRMVRHLLVVLAALGTSLPSTTHAWGLPPTLAKKAPFSRSMKAPLADINNQGPICELTSTGGHLSVDFTVAPWMEKVFESMCLCVNLCLCRCRCLCLCVCEVAVALLTPRRKHFL